jgi:UDP-N-acetylmuramoylalanine--D-glutamate ligase
VPGARGLPPGAEFAGRRVAVVGLQRSNAAVARLLARVGAEVEAYDAKPEAELGVHRESLPPGARLVAGPGYLEALDARLEGLAAVFVTPGMPKDLPVFARARALGVPLWTEAGYALAHAPCPVVGITGSAGKTTTTTLVGEAVRRVRPGSLVGGNLGLPVVDRLGELGPEDLLVLELSSFQLELAPASPHVGALLNVRPNHLDVHGTFAAYLEAKRAIYRYQGPGDYAVFGADDPVARAEAPRAPGAVVWFGAGEVAPGAGVVDGWIRWVPPSAAPDPLPPAQAVLPVSAVRLPGPHNVQNVAAALAVAALVGVPCGVFAEVARGFRGVEHRLETVRTWRGVQWVNDSIATAPDRVLAALESFPEAAGLVLLAGGYDKGLPFEELGRRVAERVRVAVLFGAAADRLEAAVRSGAAGSGRGPELVRVRDLAEAVAAAAEAARPGEVVLLSPACASYDQFRDFTERGQRFRELVAALPE